MFVRDLEIVASVGVLEHEKRYEQRIIISADLLVRDDYDGVSDRLTDVLDYSKVVDGIARLVQGEHVNLIETLAERIASQCLADRRVESVRVRIEKPDVMDTAARSASRSSGAGRCVPSVNASATVCFATRAPRIAPTGAPKHGETSDAWWLIRSQCEVTRNSRAATTGDCPPCGDRRF